MAGIFRYLRLDLGLDALDSYAKDQDDLARSVSNPKKKEAAKNVSAAKAALLAAEADVARETLEQGSAGIEGIEQAHEALADAKAAQRAVPARVALGELYPDAMRLSPERKRLHDAIRMATYNATTALCRLHASPLPPSRGRGQDAAARGAALTGPPRGHRRRAPRAHQRAVCPTAQPGDRRALCGAARDRDAQSRDEAASRLRREGLLAQLCCGRRPAAIIPTCQESWYRPPKPRTLLGYGPLARTSTKRAELVDVRSIEAQSATDSVTRSPAPPARRATDPAPP